MMAWLLRMWEYSRGRTDFALVQKDEIIHGIVT
jgi:hypothetical protein